MSTLNLWRKHSLSILNTLGDFLFPPLCIVCDQPRAQNSNWLCSSCMHSLNSNTIHRDACPVCSLNLNQRSCTCAIAHTFPFEKMYALFDYDDTIRSIMHHIKYRGKKHLAFDLGKQFAASIPETIFDNIDAVAAIPLHWTRRAKRGYNQAEWISKGVMENRHNNLPILTRAIKRIRPTKTQTKLDRESRKKNIKHAFRVVQPELVHKKNILLFDDVVTTGATTAECSRVLLEAGCTSVRVIALVRD